MAECGIAEANGVGIAAGLALTGKMVLGQFFGPFLALRALDQVHTDMDVGIMRIYAEHNMHSARALT